MAVYVSNLTINGGTDFSQVFTLESGSTNAVLNLSGYSISSQMRKHPGATGVTTTFSGPISVSEGITVSKTAVTSTGAGAVTSNTSGISHTLTLDAALTNGATHDDITITSDKVLATSVVLCSSNLNVDVRIHTVVVESFKVSITNKSGSTLSTGSEIILNYVIL